VTAYLLQRISFGDGSRTLKISPFRAANINWRNRVREYTNLLDEPVKQDGGLPDKLVLNNVKRMDLPLSTSAPQNERVSRPPRIGQQDGGVFTRR
jgi:hypothetical protein